MRTARPAYIGMLLVLLRGLPAVGQEQVRTAEIASPSADSLTRRNAASIAFDRNLNTFNWIGRAAVDTSIGFLRVALIGQYSTNVIQIDPTGGTPKRKLQSDQQAIRMQLDAPISSGLSGLVRWSSLVYTDNKGVGLSNASIHSGLSGVDYTPLPFITLTPMLGYQWDRQSEFTDRGLTTLLGAQTHGINVEGYQLAASAQYRDDHLAPRMLESHFAHFGAQKFFSGRTRDSLQIGLTRSRREFYALADSNIESRVENILTISNLIDYELESHFIASLFINVSSRGLDKTIRPFGSYIPRSPQFDARIDEFRLDTYVQALFRTDDGRTGALLRLAHSERNETHEARAPNDIMPPLTLLFAERNRQEQAKDNLTQRTSLSGVFDLPLSLSDQLYVSATAGILRYDTPSDLNLEDRDELLVAASVATRHRVSRFLDLAIALDGTLSHLVYLLKERSANNNFNRVLRLSTRSDYRPLRGIGTMNSLEVLANYTVYDFEQQVASVRSFSYRQFGWTDSTSIDITRRIGLDFFSYLKLYERGQLKWTDFTERTENSFADRTYALQVRHMPFPGTVFAVGVRYFSQSRYQYGTPGKRLESYFRSVGPTCSIVWQIGPHSQFALRGWYEQRSQTDGTRRRLGSMTMNLSMNF